MPEPSRRRPPVELARLIDEAITAARTRNDAWPTLERAHIASQPWAWPHTRVHAAMLRLAWLDRPIFRATRLSMRIRQNKWRLPHRLRGSTLPPTS